MKQPNILYIIAYRSMLADVLPTPNIDRIAREGLRADACFCTTI